MITIRVSFGNDLEELERKLMAAFDELKAGIQDVKDTVSAEKEQVAAAIAALEAKLANNLTPEQLDSLKTELADLKTAAGAIYDPPSPPNPGV